MKRKAQKYATRQNPNNKKTKKTPKKPRNPKTVIPTRAKDLLELGVLRAETVSLTCASRHLQQTVIKQGDTIKELSERLKKQQPQVKTETDSVIAEMETRFTSLLAAQEEVCKKQIKAEIAGVNKIIDNIASRTNTALQTARQPNKNRSSPQNSLKWKTSSVKSSQMLKTYSRKCKTWSIH